MSGGRRAEVALSVSGPDGALAAGAPLRVRCEIEPVEGGEQFLLVSGDAATGRPGDVSFRGALDGVALEDPAGDAVDIGGPAGAVPIAPGRPFAQELLVNQFLTLERLAGAVPAGETATLRLVLRRLLRVGRDQAEAMQSRGDAAEAELSVEVRGDPDELARIVDELADTVGGDTSPGSVPREQALTVLLSLRTPEAARRLESLREHPDPGVRARVSHALRRGEVEDPGG